MARRPGEVPGPAAPDAAKSNAAADAGSTRRERLEALLRQCASAQADAAALNEKLLSYLLGMATEETRAAISRAEALGE